MRVWLAEVGEILPIDEGGRVMRTGILARQLSAAGHEVTWWADAFNHLRKTFRSPKSAEVKAGENLTLQLLHGPAYHRNVSLARLRNQSAVAKEFRKLAPQQPEPDVIYCGYPTIELAREVVSYAAEKHIPVVMDVRDPWPHLFLEYLPSPLRWAGRLMLHSYFRKGRQALAGATALTATSEVFLDWSLKYVGRPRTEQDRVFYLAYDERSGSKEAPVELPPSDGVKLRCFFVGGFGPAYDLDTVIDAARILERDTCGAQFILSGDGPRAAELRARAAGLSSVVFTGFISGPQIRYLLARCDVGLIAITPLAITSVPNKSFEYMSGPLALLNTTVGDLRQLIDTERIGLNYAPGNAAELAEKIKQLLASPGKVQDMKQRALALFERSFSAKTVYADMCENLLSHARAAKASAKHY
jgi:glycosyltransferase involved in cell wall biosynthesis